MPPNPIDPKGQKMDKLQEGLYSRGGQDIKKTGRPSYLSYSRDADKVNKTWQEDETLTNTLTEDHHEERKMSFFTKVFLLSIVFFLVAAGIATYVLLGGFNVISSKNVDISVQGLIAVAAGEELSLDINVSNNNNVALEQGELFVEYPPGTRMASDLTQNLTQEKVVLDNIPAGGTETKTVKAVLFGEKDSVQEIKITLNYKAHGSNASFSKDKTYDVTIKSSPVLMDVSYPQEVNSGQNITATVNITSNSAEPIKNLLLRAEYPFGFTFVGATPFPDADNNVWRIANLNPNEKRTFVINGKIEGQDQDERTIKFDTGIADVNDENQIGIGFISTLNSILIKKPFITLDMKLNQVEDTEYSAKIGDEIRGNISWANNLPEAINDAQLQVKFSGDVIDRETVSTNSNGFYNSGDNTITWDKNNFPEFSSINPNDTNSVDFDFHFMPSTSDLIASGRNLETTVDVSIQGTHVSGDSTPQTISSTLSRVIKIATNLDLNARTLYSIGPFANSGPIPPAAEQNTSYTVDWAFSNTFNDVTGAKVTATLPPYVKWLGNINPGSEDITYDDSSRTITWNAGEVKAGSGFVSSPREVYFQVMLTPSQNQVGNIPTLIDNIQFSGTDRFTGKGVTGTKSPLTTRASTDPNYNSGNETIVR